MVYHFLESEEEGRSGGRFTKSCRCGAEEGYVLTEEDMDDVEEEVRQQEMNNGSKARSMIIGCLGCSLWVQVDWVVCDSDDEGGE